MELALQHLVTLTCLTLRERNQRQTQSWKRYLIFIHLLIIGICTTVKNKEAVKNKQTERRDGNTLLWTYHQQEKKK